MSNDLKFGIKFWLGIALMIAFLFTPVFIAIQNEREFTRECHAVGGQVDKDSDGDVECYRNGREIAEMYENSPYDPR